MLRSASAIEALEGEIWSEMHSEQVSFAGRSPVGFTLFPVSRPESLPFTAAADNAGSLHRARILACSIEVLHQVSAFHLWTRTAEQREWCP